MHVIGLGFGSEVGEVLCLGAHPDDIEIGCGGALLQLATDPSIRVRGAVLTGDAERGEEARAALDRFVPGATVEVGGLPDGRLPGHWTQAKDLLERVARTTRPDVVLAPRTDDAHQDHRLVGRLAGTVWRDALILHYEIPKWDGDMKSPTHYVVLEEEHARRKVELLRKCFGSQVSRDWWDDELFLGLMRIRGVESRASYAEGFFAHKVLIALSEGDGHAEP
jgi:LmbE family N-acetylglucosaminyl deacetylase